MKQHILLFILLAFSCQATFGQSLKAFKKSAQEAYENMDYPTALVHSRKVLAEDSTNLEFLGIAGKSALEVCAFDAAETYFTTINELDNQYPDILFFLAKVQHRKGNYGQAMELYQQYIDYSSYPAYAPLAETMLNRYYQNEELFSGGYSSEGVSLLAGGNPGESYFALPAFRDSIYYSAVVPSDPGQCDCVNPCEEELQLFRTDAGRGNPYRVTFSDDFNNVGHITYSKNRNRMYFTQCNCEDGQYTCKIYYRDRNQYAEGYEETWSEAKLAEAVNWEGYTSTQPFLYTDSYGAEYLFFASDYKSAESRGEESNEGQRDLDIWYSVVQEGRCAAPENVSVVNTERDEMTPFYHGPTGVFYFSTNGRASYGGYDFDVYHVKGSPGNWNNESLTNAGAPINSLYNDFYFSMNEFGDKGYFSSNRHEGYYASQIDYLEHCCPAIYEVDMKTDVRVATYCDYAEDREGLPLAPLEQVEVALKNFNGQVVDANKRATGNNSFLYEEVRLNSSFVFEGTRDFYSGDRVEFNSSELEEETVNLFLKPDMKLDIYFRDFCDEETMVPVGRIIVTETFPVNAGYGQEQRTETYFCTYEEFGKGPGHFSLDLKPYTTYQIVPDIESIQDVRYSFVDETPKCGFTTECIPEEFSHTFLLNIEPEVLPWVNQPLFFYHAEPNINGSRVESQEGYLSLYSSYMDRQQEFANNPYCINPGEAEELFNQIEEGKNNLVQFMQTRILPDLEDRDDIDSLKITIEGFASISKSGGYSNLDLTKRRGDSMKKYFQKELEDKKRREIRSVVESVEKYKNDFGSLRNRAETAIKDTYPAEADAILRIIENYEGFFSELQYAAKEELRSSCTQGDAVIKMIETYRNRFKNLERKAIGELKYSYSDKSGEIEEIENKYNCYSSKIAIKIVAKGDDDSDKTAPRTKACRIYNKSASEDRRIEIVEITYIPKGYNCRPVNEYGPCAGIKK